MAHGLYHFYSGTKAQDVAIAVKRLSAGRVQIGGGKVHLRYIRGFEPDTLLADCTQERREYRLVEPDAPITCTRCKDNAEGLRRTLERATPAAVRQRVVDMAETYAVDARAHVEAMKELVALGQASPEQAAEAATLAAAVETFIADMKYAAFKLPEARR